MNKEIVTRLQMFSLDDGTDALNKLLAESADEIERLRAEIYRLQRLLAFPNSEEALRGYRQ